MKKKTTLLNLEWWNPVLWLIWKESIVQSRKRFDLLLLLCQIFLWFGWDCLRFAYLSESWYPPIAASNEHLHMELFKRVSLPSNHQIGITVDGGFSDFTEHNARPPSWDRVASTIRKQETIDPVLFANTAQLFTAFYGKSTGFQVLGVYEDREKLVTGMEKDNRIHFGIVINRLNSGSVNVDAEMIFYDNEVPVALNPVQSSVVCRPSMVKFPGNEFTMYSLKNRGSCKPLLYRDSSLFLAETALANAVIYSRSGFDASEFENSAHQFQASNPYELNLPGLNLVVEPAPAKIQLKTQYEGLIATLPATLILAFGRIITTSLLNSISDSTTGFKHMLRIYGLSRAQYKCAALINAMIINVLYTSVTVGLCRFATMFGSSNYVIIWILFYFYLLSLQTLGMLAASICRSKDYAILIAVSLNFGLNGLALLWGKQPVLTGWVRVLFSLISPVILVHTVRDILLGLPHKVLGISELLACRNNSFLLNIATLAFTSLAYWGVSFYIDGISDRGSANGQETWMNCIMHEFSTRWRGEREREDATHLLSESFHTQDMQANEFALRAINVEYRYKNGDAFTLALDGFTLDVKKQEILCLLGHNGCGKSTFIKLACGQLNCGKGYIQYDGVDVSQILTAECSILSVCPQDDMFIEGLTVLENVLFYAGMRGIDCHEVLIRLRDKDRAMLFFAEVVEGKNGHADGNACAGTIRMLHRFGLLKRCFNFPSTLSGGEKRKLSLCISLLGDPAVVFLDEPSSGVDPHSRVQIWNAIREEREAGRTIIITTHHMEEADVLGDRKALIKNGKVICIGSSSHFREVFGIGYSIEIFMAPTSEARDIDKLKSQISEILKESRARFVYDDKDPLRLQVRTSTGRTSEFGNLFDMLDANVTVRDACLSISDLNQIYYNLESHDIITSTDDAGTTSPDTDAGCCDNPNQNIDLMNERFALTEDRSFSDRLWTILVLRFTRLYRNRLELCTGFVFPIVCTVGGLILARLAAESSGQQLMEGTVFRRFNYLELYGDYFVPVISGGVLTQQEVELQQGFVHELSNIMNIREVDHLVHEPGVGNDLQCPYRSAWRAHNKAHFFMLMEEGVPDFGRTVASGSNSLREIAEISEDLYGTPLEGLRLRNFVWKTSHVSQNDEWTNFYPTALSFEGMYAKIPQVQVPRHRIRALWTPAAVHAIATLIPALSSAMTMVDPRLRATILNFSARTIVKKFPISAAGTLVSLFSGLSLGVTQTPTKLALEIVEERNRKVRQYLFVQGVGLGEYWLGSGIVDLGLLFSINVVLAVVIFFSFPMFAAVLSLTVPILIMIISYCAAMLAFGYFWGRLFRSASAFSLFMQLSSPFMGTAPAVIVAGLWDVDMDVNGISTTRLARVLHILFSLFLAPYLPLGGFFGLIVIARDKLIGKDAVGFAEFWGFDGFALYTVLGSALQTAFYSLMIYAFEVMETNSKPYDHAATQYLKKELCQHFAADKGQQAAGAAGSLYQCELLAEDADVAEEKVRAKDCARILRAQRIAHENGRQVPVVFPNIDTPVKRLPGILVDGVYYVYANESPGNGYVVAVRDLSLCVEKGCILGLLGPNGAGKSTFLGLLGGDMRLSQPTAGRMYIGGHDLRNAGYGIYKSVGVVFQEDCLFGDLTVQDSLNFFAHVKGLTAEIRHVSISNLCGKLGLTKYLRVPVNQLSGGCKRRVSMAIALLGNPSVLLLDEPTTGIDPEGRVQIRHLIREQKATRSVLVTTHCMEEAEALCSRLSLMVDGTLKCVNTPMAVKAKYGRGMRLQCILSPEAMNNSARVTMQLFEWVKCKISQGTTVFANMDTRISFHVPLSNKHIAKIFHCMESVPPELCVESFTLGQESLAQVFADFTNLQSSKRKVPRRSE